MEEGILANIKMISSMVMGNFVGLMVENTKEIGKYLYFFMWIKGKMENSMAGFKSH